MIVPFLLSVLCMPRFITCVDLNEDDGVPKLSTELGKNQNPSTNEVTASNENQKAVEGLTQSQKFPTNFSVENFSKAWQEFSKFSKLLYKTTRLKDDTQVDQYVEVGGLRKNLRKPHITRFHYDGPRKDYFRETPTTTISECNAIYSCSDCYTARICRPLANGTFQFVASVKCPPAAPHCDLATGTCKWQASPECLNPDKFICLSDGNFPDVDCNFYHVCRNLTSEKRQCEDKYEYYNADRGECDAETKYCGFFDCFQQTVGTKTPYTTFPNYYAYCNGKQDPLVIDKCSEGTWLNITTQKCEPMCSENEGVIADPFDCTKYYKCSRQWTSKSDWTMAREHKDCPYGTGFDPKNFMCLSLQDLPFCQPTAIPPNTDQLSVETNVEHHIIHVTDDKRTQEDVKHNIIHGTDDKRTQENEEHHIIHGTDDKRTQENVEHIINGTDDVITQEHLS